MKKTWEKIIDYVRDKKQVTASELVDILEITPRAVFKQLKKLIEKGVLQKTGRPPKVFYFPAKKGPAIEQVCLAKPLEQSINKNYLHITPLGEIKQGLEGFAYWCTKNNLPLGKTAKEYQKTLKKYHAFSRQGLVNGMKKMEQTFDEVFLNSLHYIDFYSIERFGKTKLGQLLLYAKQSQNRGFIKQLVDQIKPRVDDLIKKHHIDAIGFIPPTVKREVQFMKELQKHLHPKAPILSIVKVKTPVIVPQKTLSKLADRIENASRTIIVDEKRIHKNILLIDDAVGSGATLNETARQLQEKGIATGKIIGLSITGSFKGFDVISEV